MTKLNELNKVDSFVKTTQEAFGKEFGSQARLLNEESDEVSANLSHDAFPDATLSNADLSYADFSFNDLSTLFH